MVLGWIGDMAPIENKCSAMSPSWVVVIGWVVIAHGLAKGGLRGTSWEFSTKGEGIWVFYECERI